MARPFRLYHGDCLEVLDSLPPESVDLIFADPPYNLSNDGFTCQGGRMVSVNKGGWDKSKGFNLDVAFHHSWLLACRRVLKPNGALWVSGTYHSIYACGHALQFLGYHILNDICWFKPNASYFSNFFNNCHNCKSRALAIRKHTNNEGLRLPPSIWLTAGRVMPAFCATVSCDKP
jgi:DNA modification methylase